MMRIKIILEVDADELDWGKSSVEPTDNGVGGALLDFDLDQPKFMGEPVEFADTDKACDYLQFLREESDQKDHSYA